jgi:penicillin-insensitive murein endopeptidase
MWSCTGRIARALACGLAITIAPAAASATPAAGDIQVAARTRSNKGKKGAQSIGAPNNGRLVGAARLRGGKALRQREGGHSWGLPQLVRLLQHAATEVARKHHGSQMLVGDLSGRTGGHLDHHNSHQSGRDADVGFYVMNSKGKPMAVKRFIPFDDAGNARDAPGVRFDEARNWTMVEAMLKDDKASVRYLFITSALRGKLLAHATKKHVAKALLEKAASVMMSPQDADLHDDHMHVRIACPGSMHDVCIEESTVHEDRPTTDVAHVSSPPPDPIVARGYGAEPGQSRWEPGRSPIVNRDDKPAEPADKSEAPRTEAGAGDMR